MTRRSHTQRQLPNLPLRMAALLCVLLVLMLDVLAAAPQLHEAVCHHNRDQCCHSDHGDSQGSGDHSHNGNSCDGCIITQFAAGHVSRFDPETILPTAKGKLVAVLALRIPIEVVCERNRHLWPHSCAPPAIVALHPILGPGIAA